MEYIKCSDCGKIYKTSLEACPQCGCPTEKQPKLPIVDESVPIDVKELFSISEDKFEETKDITIIGREVLSSSIDELRQGLDIDAPRIFLEYHIEKGIGQLRIIYFEKELIEKIESSQDRELWDKFGSPCKRMTINIDDKENIRLDIDDGGRIAAWCVIDKEMFLKCCNAKKLEFKITKENGASIIVNGYYGYDPETGAEIDVNGDVVPENDLILNFQALYNYVIDSNMFKDALQRRKLLDDWNNKQKEKIEGEVKKEETKEVEDNNPGSGWVIFGILIMVIGLILVISDFSDIGSAFVIGIVMFVCGAFPIVYGAARMNGQSNEEALETLKKAVDNMNH